MSHHYSGIYSVYGVNGRGEAYIFQDGAVTKGSWLKASRNNQLSFVDSNNKPIALNPGQTWISLVSSTDAIKFNP